MKKVIISFLCISALVSIGLMLGRAQAQEAKKREVTGRHVYTISSLTDLAAVTIIGRNDLPEGSGKGKGKGKGDDEGEKLEIEIEGEDITLDRISGYNHDINNKNTLIGSNNKPGISTDVEADTEDFKIDDDVLVAGVPSPVVYEIDPIAVKDYVNYYKDHANFTVDSPGLTQWGTSNSKGGPTDYKVVYVKNSKLKLYQDFKGYGILVLYDDTPGAGKAELRMEDTATWYGLIISYTEDTSGESDKIKISLGNGSSGEGKGKGKGSPGTGVTVLGSILLETREGEIKLDLADVYYCKQAMDNVDSLVNTKMKFQWEKYKEPR